MKDTERRYHRRWYRMIKSLAAGIISRYMHFSCEPIKSVQEPYILLANHNTDLDPVMLGKAFPGQMYFVASEHVFRKGFWSNVLLKLFAPIPRVKGSTDAAAALEIIRRSRRGDNICLFPEGNRSFTGVTGPIFPATGKLVRTAGATLYTYRFEGGYLACPRWGRSGRRGKIRGQLVGCYSPDELKKMKPEEINALIARDLYEDAFARQEEVQLSYRDSHQAEYLEAALYICPKCGKISTMKSENDRFFCTHCGLTLTYTERGSFAGKEVPFQNVRDWDAWQSEQMKLLAEGEGDEELFFDETVAFSKFGENHETVPLGSGRISMSRGKLTVGEHCFPLETVSGMGLFGRANIAFSVGAEHYEIKFAPGVCGRKYFALYEEIRGRQA